LVVLIITLVQQIIINIDTQIADQTKPIVWADLTIDNQTWRDNDSYNALATLITDNGGQIIRVTEFYTTVVWPQETKLVQVKAVESGFPRYGELVIADITTSQTALSTALDLDNGVWIDPETHAIIDNADTIQVWSTTFPIRGIITEQASLGFNFLDEGRTIIMPYALVSETDLTNFGSRVSHELQVKTSTDEQAERLKTLINEQYGEALRVRLARDRIEQLWGIIDQLNQYTSIILIITLVLSLMVMATATMTMTLNITPSIAIMRVLGITRGQTAVMTIMLFGGIFVIGAMIGIGLAYRGFSILGSIVEIAANFVWYPSQLVTIGLLSVVSFAIACRQSILHLSTTHPLSLLKSSGSDTPYNYQTPWVLWWGTWIVLAILTQTILFAGLVVIISAGLLGAGYRLLMQTFRLLHSRFHSVRKGHFLRFDASRQTIIPGNQTGLLVGGLSSALVGFCIIIAVSLSFLERLDTSAVDQPNLFVLNVRNDDIQPIKDFDPGARLYDTILGRISHINTIPLTEFLGDQGGREWEFTREFNITTQPLDNSPIARWSALSQWGISLDQDFATRLGVWLGDSLRLFIQGRSFDLSITSLRKSIRTGAEPFFLLQIDETQFAQAPRSWFWVTRQPDDQLNVFQQSALDTIGRHLSFIDISTIIALVTDISQKIISIVIVCMTIIIVLIILVSIASNEASALVARQTYWLYHILGMTKSSLKSISRRVGWLYIIAILVILLILVTTLLWLIYSNASILTWTRASIWPILWGVIMTIVVMILSYGGFHKLIIEKL
jgi:putative ABC transport system permease protein